uniref:Protein TsetseEP domain-containing protein n=1 Tax=Musca domestica TaxID=7370 RepID=A0A1I8NKZ7_MUSDO
MEVYKYFTVFLLCSLSVLQVKADDQDERTTNFIEANSHRYVNYVQDCDYKLDSLKNVYAASISTIDIQMEFLLKSVEQAAVRLSNLELLSVVNKECSEKYKNAYPEISTIKTMIQNCTDNAQKQFPSLLVPLQETRDKFALYYNQTFQGEISNCDNMQTSKLKNFNHTNCIKNVVSDATSFVIANQKTFDYQLNSAKCSADTYIKMALDCSYVAQTTVVSLITATNVFIDRCTKNIDCMPCEGFQCENVYNLPTNAIDYASQTMVNPFYGNNQTLSCLMINIV